MCRRSCLKIDFLSSSRQSAEEGVEETALVNPNLTTPQHIATRPNHKHDSTGWRALILCHRGHDGGSRQDTHNTLLREREGCGWLPTARKDTCVTQSASINISALSSLLFCSVVLFPLAPRPSSFLIPRPLFVVVSFFFSFSPSLFLCLSLRLSFARCLFYLSLSSPSCWSAFSCARSNASVCAFKDARVFQIRGLCLIAHGGVMHVHT